MIGYVIPIASGVIAVGAFVYAVKVRRDERKMMDRLNTMIDQASEGTFQATDYDESEVSALENRFAHFLDSSLASKEGLREEKDRIKEMISDISHQTKTPIANLLLYSELLREDESLSAENEESLEIIHSQTEKLRFLVDSLVKLSRLENGIVSLHTGKNSLRELVHCAVTDLSNKAEQKGLSLTESYDFEDEGEASFDEKWTYEALVNLIDNAIKYTEKGSVEVRVSVSDVFARIDVKDTGIGISEEESAKVFQRFYRSGEVSSEEGVGIGLYLAREIITAEGGYIRLTSAKGKGSTFSVFIPV